MELDAFKVLYILLIAFSCNAEKLIIDTDGGPDDAMAILLLLRAEYLKESHVPQYEVVGITCSYGNTQEENVEINILKTLTIANRSDIPVFGGVKKPLIGGFSTDNYYGKDGFGDAKFDKKIIAKVNKSMLASVALVELTKLYDGNVSILIIGPTTNVALATSLDENFISRVEKFYVMGSSVAGLGKRSPNVEFNFGLDPESNFILLNSTTSSKLTLFPWEAAIDANISKTWRKDVLGKFKTPYIEFLNAIEKMDLNTQDVYTPADAMTAATMLWPNMIKSTLETNVRAVFDGAARGSVLVDYYKTRPANARVIRFISADVFRISLLQYLACETC